MSSCHRIPIIYEQDAAIGLLPNVLNFLPQIDGGSVLPQYSNSLWDFQGTIDATTNNGTTVSPEIDNIFFQELPYTVNYIKFRLKEMQIVRGNLEYDDGTAIPETSLPPYEPSPMCVIFDFDYLYTDFGGIVNDNGNIVNNPPQVNDTPKRITTINTPSEWIFFDTGINNFDWTFQIDLLPYYNNPVIINRDVFLQQRLKDISFTFEFEFEYAPPISEQSIELQQEDVTMVNLYKMLDTFMQKRESKTKKDNRDGITSDMVEAIKTKKAKAKDKKDIIKIEKEQKTTKLISVPSALPTQIQPTKKQTKKRKKK